MKAVYLVFCSLAIISFVCLAAYFGLGLIPKAYNEIRPLVLTSGGESCLENLRAQNHSIRSLGDMGTNECPILNAVKIEKFSDTTLSSPIVLSCPAALSVASWLNDIQARHIVHMGTLNCRRQRGSGFLSEHSFGLAIDISEIDGAKVSRDWNNSSTKGIKLKKAAEVACEHFSNVLTPEANSLHHSHFHLDVGIGRGC